MGGMLAVLVAMVGATLVQRYLLSRAAVKIDGQTLDFLTGRLLALPMSYFHSRRTGDIQRRLAGMREVRTLMVQEGVRGRAVADDLGLDRDLPEIGAEQRLATAGVEQRLEIDGRALVGGQALDEEGRPLFDAVLLPAGADDGVRGFGHGFRSLAGFGDFRGAAIGFRTRTAPSASAAAAPRLR